MTTVEGEYIDISFGFVSVNNPGPSLQNWAYHHHHELRAL